MKKIKKLISYIISIIGLLLTIICPILIGCIITDRILVTSHNDKITYIIGLIIYCIVGIAFISTGRSLRKKPAEITNTILISKPDQPTSYEQEEQYLIYLSDMNKSTYGISSALYVDTRDWTPYHIMLIKDKDNPLHTRYHSKKRLTWLEVEELANPVCKAMFNTDVYKHYRHLVYDYRLEDHSVHIAYRLSHKDIMNIELINNQSSFTLKYSTDKINIIEKVIYSSKDLDLSDYQIFKHYIRQLLKQYIDLKLPVLSASHQSGNIGKGESLSEGIINNEVVIVNKSTDYVRYHYYTDGTLIFVGQGPTKSVAFGGYDGDLMYKQEDSPFSEDILNHAKKLIVCNGITAIGSGLISGFKNLEEIILSDSVEIIKYNIIDHLKVLKTGLLFKSYNGYGGKLEELILPDHIVHLPYHNGEKAGLISDHKDITALIFKKLAQEYEYEMSLLYRDYTDIIQYLTYIPYFDKEEAQRTIFNLNHNSQYKKTRYIPKEDLFSFFDTDECEQEELILDIQKQSVQHPFFLHGGLIYIADIKKCKKIILNTDYSISEGLMYFYKSVLKDIEIIINDFSLNDLSVPEFKEIRQSGEWYCNRMLINQNYFYNTMLKTIEDLCLYIINPMTLIQSSLGKQEHEYIQDYLNHKDLSVLDKESDVLAAGGLNNITNQYNKIYLYNNTSVIDIWSLNNDSVHTILSTLLYYRTIRQ